MEIFSYSRITQGNPSSFYDESLYKIRHENNRIFIQSFKVEIVSHANPNPSSSILDPPPLIKIFFMIRHHIVPDECDELYFGDEANTAAMGICFSLPLTVLESYKRAKPAFQDLLSRLRLPFEFRTEFGEFRWGSGFWFEDEVPIQGFDGVVDRISAESVRMAHRGTKPFAILVRLMKRTVVGSERFDVLSGFEDRKILPAAVEMMRYRGGDDSECSICLRGVVIGAQVAKLPCSHKFHKYCIASWLDRSQTCPLCRFHLVNNSN